MSHYCPDCRRFHTGDRALSLLCLECEGKLREQRRVLLEACKKAMATCSPYAAELCRTAIAACQGQVAKG